MRIVEMVRNDIKKSSLLRTKVLIYAFNGRTFFYSVPPRRCPASQAYNSPHLISKGGQWMAESFWKSMASLFLRMLIKSTTEANLRRNPLCK